MNNLAQSLEIIHSIDQIVCTLEKLLDVGVKDEKPEVKVRAGEGVAATEAPRGTLYHHYKINDAGRVEYANIITPTAQNLKNMEEDLKAVVPQLLDLPKDEIVLNLEKLIRAYDPCISCSTHFLETKFV
jgi:coenzyme F420-reducing hydrogenase alpha subunit